jgi:hypothetical protein
MIYYKSRNMNMEKMGYINELKKHINDDEIEYDTFNIFKYPVIRLIFWKNRTEDEFFALYKYKDKYFSISDNKGIYKIINHEFDDMYILSILLKKIVIYNSLDDIYISKSKYKNGNESLSDEIHYLRSFFC